MSESAVSAATLEELKAKAAAGRECAAFQWRPRPSEPLLKALPQICESRSTAGKASALARDLQTALTFGLCRVIETSGAKLRRKR